MMTEESSNEVQTIDPHALAAGPNALASPSVVEELVRSFMVNVTGIRASYQDRSLPPEDCAPAIDKLSLHFQAIFYGEDADQYPPVTSWNVPGSLGQFICERMGWSKTAQSEAVQMLFHRLASDLLDVIVAAEKGTADEERIQFETQALVDSYRDILMGIPPGHEA